MCWLEDAERVDLAVHAAVARTPTPTLDQVMSRLSSAADYSCLSPVSAGLLAVATTVVNFAQLMNYAGDWLG